MITATIVTNSNKTRYKAQASVTSPPVVPVHSTWRHEDGELEARLGYKMRLYLKNKSGDGE